MIPRFALIERASDKRRFRYLDRVDADSLGLDDELDYAVVIAVNAVRPVWPEWHPFRQLAEGLADRSWRIRPDNRPSIDVDALLAGDHAATLKKRVKLIERAVREELKLYTSAGRAEVARILQKEGLGTRPFFYATLRLYWIGGGVRDALVPNFHRSGAPGVKRVPAEGSKKVGRPRTHSPGTGVAMTELHRVRMQHSLAKAAFGKNAGALLDNYHLMLGTHYAEHVQVESAAARNRYEILHPDHVPSFDQYRYYWGLLYNWKDRQIQRFRKSGWERLTKLLTTGTLRNVHGPGTRYYIDATVLDLYVVSRLNRHRIIGRPTLYIVADQFSRLIVGIYIGLEPPSWVGAMLALWNCNLDKVEFCARYGVEITPEVWPTGYMPLHLLGDNGELKSAQAKQLAAGFRLDVENARAYRGEAKSIVERDFRSTQATFGEWLPGAVLKDVPYEESSPPALSAALDLEQTYTLLICRTLLHNHRLIRDYDGEHQISHDEVAFRPIDLWHWGARNIRTDYRRYTDDHLIRHLWPDHKLKLNNKALKFYRGLYLMGQELREKDWFQRALVEQQEFSAKYWPNELGRQYLLPQDARETIIPVEMTPRSAQFAGISHAELMAYEAQKSRQNKKAEAESIPNAVRWTRGIADVVDTAKKQAKAVADNTESAASRLKGIHANKLQEMDSLAVEALHKAFVKPVDANAPAHEVLHYESDDDATRAQVDALITGARR